MLLRLSIDTRRKKRSPSFVLLATEVVTHRAKGVGSEIFLSFSAIVYRGNIHDGEFSLLLASAGANKKERRIEKVQRQRSAIEGTENSLSRSWEMSLDE